MHFGRLITGGAAVFADVRTYWSSESVKKATGLEPTGKAANGFIHLINSGAAALDGCGESKDENGNPVIKKWWELNEKDIKSCIDACELSPADLLYFRGGGYSTRFTTRQEMPVTLIRVNMVEGVGPTLQIAEGYTLALPEEMSDKIWKRTDYTWPSTYFAPNLTGKGAFTSVYKVMSAWGANHGAFVYGHVGAKLITLASMLRIPVPMHNVSEEEIFRPHSWNAFGTNDLESADMRACAAYGPLYK
jgi:L-fucose isomerase